MKSKIILVILLLVGISQAKPNGPKKDRPEMKIACMGKELVLPSSLNETKSCQQKVFGTEDLSGASRSKPEWKKKGMCMMVCQAQKIGVMDDEYKIDITKIQQLLEGEMEVPKEAMEKLNPVMEKCVADFGSGLKITDDCSSMEKLFHCMKDNFIKTCMPELAEIIKKMEDKE